MKTELLILKSGNEYIRINPPHDSPCGLDKASVFPLDQITVVERHVKRLVKLGFTNVHIKKLIITEEDIS